MSRNCTQVIQCWEEGTGMLPPPVTNLLHLVLYLLVEDKSIITITTSRIPPGGQLPSYQLERGTSWGSWQGRGGESLSILYF